MGRVQGGYAGGMGRVQGGYAGGMGRGGARLVLVLVGSLGVWGHVLWTPPYQSLGSGVMFYGLHLTSRSSFIRSRRFPGRGGWIQIQRQGWLDPDLLELRQRWLDLYQLFISSHAPHSFLPPLAHF